MYKLEYIENGTRYVEKYISFEKATNKLMKLGKGKLYLADKNIHKDTLVGEL